MATMKITIEDMGVTKTYEKDFGEECITVEDFFETCLGAYDAQGYQNDIDVDIYGIGGNITQTVSWSKDDGVNVSEETDAMVLDLMDFMHKVESKVTCEDDVDIYHFNDGISESRSKDKWYMGHRY